MKRGLVCLIAIVVAFMAIAISFATTASAQTFTYTTAGQLVPDSAGNGVNETRALASAMRFPIESAPAYANSQVWGRGGYLRGVGAECDKENFSYPWHDNYCEKRDWSMPLCPGGKGHQGQDIRAASCKNLTHWSVATVDGTIIEATGPGTGKPGYSVLLAGADGTRYRYLHMGNVVVKSGQAVKQGQRLGMVSREFNGTPTTVHLHFDIMQNVAQHGMVWVSPYMSLVRSYERLLGIAGADADAGAVDPDASPGVDPAATPPIEEEENGRAAGETETETELEAVPEPDGCTFSERGTGFRAPAWGIAVAFACAVARRRRKRVR